jgi:hypothetical protein
MTRLLGTLLALFLLLPVAGCGEDTDARSEDPADRSSSESSSPSSGSSSPSSGESSGVDFTEVALLSETNAGGAVSTRPTVLDDPATIATFTSGLEGRTLPGKIRAEARRTTVPGDRVLVGAVVAIGCDVPPGVAVQSAGNGLQITPLKAEKPHLECFAPVTTVALLLVDAAAL